MLKILMVFSIVSLYVPHHHHDGKVCMTQSDGNASHATHEDEGHSEQIDLQIEKKNNPQIEKAITNLVGLTGYRIRIVPGKGKNEKEVEPVAETGCFLTHIVRTQKLRGSPIFS